jgi:iron complex outermembrane receptor protein
VAPSLTVAQGGGATTSYFVRGVGNFTNNAYSDPAVAFNYDGVYIGRPTSTGSAFFDLERIEVLKGPQARCTAAMRLAARSMCFPPSR